MADSDKNILITPNISATTYPQIKFVGKDNAPMYQTVQDDGTISFSGAQGEVFSIGPSMALGTIFSANDISGVPLFKVLASGAVNVSSGRLCVGTDTPVAGMALTLNGDGTSYEGIAFQVDGSTKWKMSTDSSGFYWDSQVNNMDLNFRIRDSGGNQNYFRMTADGGTIGPKFVVGANAHTIPDSQAGIEVTDAGQANLRVTDSSASASSDFAQSENDTYIINRKTNGDMKFRVNGSNELITLDGGDTTAKFPLGVESTSTSRGWNLWHKMRFGKLDYGTAAAGGAGLSSLTFDDNEAGLGNNAIPEDITIRAVQIRTNGVVLSGTTAQVWKIFANGDAGQGTLTNISLDAGDFTRQNSENANSTAHTYTVTGLSASYDQGDLMAVRRESGAVDMGDIVFDIYYSIDS